MKAHIFRPPVIAVWLVGFFTPDKQTEAIQGDLVEEFSRLASASGVAAARRWYWRQSINTVAHLMGTGVCKSALVDCSVQLDLRKIRAIPAYMSQHPAAIRLAIARFIPSFRVVRLDSRSPVAKDARSIKKH